MQFVGFTQLMLSERNAPSPVRCVWIQVLLPAVSCSGVQAFGQLLRTVPLYLGRQMFSSASLGSGHVREFEPQGHLAPLLMHWTLMLPYWLFVKVIAILMGSHAIMEMLVKHEKQ